MRGNRTVKVSSGDLDAFDSPNMSPLVKVKLNHIYFLSLLKVI